MQDIHELAQMRRPYSSEIEELRQELRAEFLELFEKQGRDIANLITRLFNEQQRPDSGLAPAVFKLQGQMAEVLDRLNDQPTDQPTEEAHPKLLPAHQMPGMADVTRLKLQFFDNTGRTRSGFRRFRLKVYVWTCPVEEVHRYLHGNYEEFYFLMGEPGTKPFRRSFKTSLDHLLIPKPRYAGCLVANSGDTRHRPNVAARIDANWNLRLCCDGQEYDLGFGAAKPSDAADGSPERTWNYRAE